MWFLLIAGCQGPDGPLTGEVVHDCEVAWAEPPTAENWSGPSEEEVLADVAAAVPTEVVWERTLSVDRSPVSVTVERTDAPARVIAYEEPDDLELCPTTPELTIPVRFGIDIGEGGVTASFLGDLGVPDGEAEVHVYGQGEWAASAAERVRASRDDPPEASDWWTRLSLSSVCSGCRATYPWPGALVGVSAIDGNRSTLLWSGTLQP